MTGDTPAAFVNLGTLPLASLLHVRWAPGGPAPVHPAAAIVDLGSIQVFIYSEGQAAALEKAFGEARRLHAAGGQS